MIRPRVVHITPALFGNNGIFGGAERYSYELARHMARFTTTTLVSFSESPQQFTTPDGLRIQTLGPPWYVRGQRFNPVHLGLIRAVAAADVVHCHQPHTMAAELSALLARIAGRRVYASDLGGGGWGFASRIRTDGWFHGYLHISGYSRKIAGHEGRAGSEIIYGGVDTDLFSPDPSIAKEPLVVFVGRLMAHKGVNYLIDALPEGMRLELIGRPYQDEYHRELKRLAEGKTVTFRYDCDDAELVRAYQRAVCVVLPSVYRDCFGFETRVPELLGQTLLEGMACGTPGLCTSVGSLPEVVDHGKTGLVVPPNEPAALRTALERFRDNPTEAIALGAAGRKRVLSRFSWSAVVERCLSAYRPTTARTGGLRTRSASRDDNKCLTATGPLQHLSR